MPSLSIKNVPEGTMERLRERAKRNHRSLQGEMLAILDDALKPRTLTVDEAYQRVRDLGIRTPDESTAMVREDRDSR